MKLEAAHINISEKTTMLLCQYHDKMIAVEKKKFDDFSNLSILKFLEHGISMHDAPFELAGKMVRFGWSNLRYDNRTSSWRATPLYGYEHKEVSLRDVENMLELEE